MSCPGLHHGRNIGEVVRRLPPKHRRGFRFGANGRSLKPNLPMLQVSGSRDSVGEAARVEIELRRSNRDGRRLTGHDYGPCSRFHAHTGEGISGMNKSIGWVCNYWDITGGISTQCCKRDFWAFSPAGSPACESARETSSGTGTECWPSRMPILAPQADGTGPRRHDPLGSLGCISGPVEDFIETAPQGFVPSRLVRCLQLTCPRAP